MLCSMDNGTTLMFPEVDPGSTAFKTEDVLVLDVAPSPVAAPSHTTELGMTIGGGCKSSACYTPGYTITNVVDNGGRHRASRAVLPTGPRSMIMVRMVYNDAAPDYCDENCMRSVMWSGSQNTNGMFTESSYGKATFPQSQGKVVTVTINKNVMSQANCPFWEMGLDADTAVQQQHGIDTSQYTHRSYYIPRNAPGCYWGVVAYIGCSSTHCKSWIRDANGPVLAHEIGHNLGLQHAGLDSDNDGSHDGGLTGEYGDHSGIMGNSALWRGVNAPHRIGLGWMPSASVLAVSSSCAAKQSVTLSALAVSPGTYSVIKIPRAKGGHYFVSYRKSQGYDSTMSTAFVNMVSIQYETTTAKASSYIKGLADGQDFSDGGNLNLKVVSMSGNSAVVSLCGGTSGGGGGGSGPPPAPPPQGCTDSHNSCDDWKLSGYCTNSAYQSYMETTCRAACGLCGGGGGPPPPPPPPPTPAPPPQGGCADKHNSCASWKSSGYCSSSSQYYKYMVSTCPQTCNLCDGGGGGGGDPSPPPAPPPPSPPPAGCTDKHNSCADWKAANYCLESSTYYDYVSDTCPASCGTCGGPNPPSPTTPAPPSPPPPAPNGDNSCDDSHGSCSQWASQGYCSPSSGYYAYVIKTCKSSCNACGSATTTSTTTTASTKPESVAIILVAPTLLPLDNPSLQVTVAYSTNIVGAKVNIIVEKPGSSMNIAQLASGAVVVETKETKTSGTVTYELDVNVAGVSHDQPLYVRAEVAQGGSTLSQSAIVTIKTAGSGGTCQDEHGSCGYWGGEGHCSMVSKHYEFMRHRCKMTCNLCATASPIGDPPTGTTTRDPSKVQDTTVSTTAASAVTTKTTEPPLATKSEKNCDFFGWELRFKNKYVCGESDQGMGGCQKLKPWFKTGTKWTGADRYCEGFGARLCTRSELLHDAAKGTGCGYDAAKKNTYVWTSDKCTDANGKPGQWIAGAAGKIKVEPICAVLWGKNKHVASMRCCADVFEDTAAKVAFLVDGVESTFSSPSHLPPVNDVYPDNYGDVELDESEFQMPPIPPPKMDASTLPDEVGGEAEIDTSTDGTTLEEESLGAGKSTAGVAATVVAAVAFVLMLVVIAVVIVVRRKRNKEHAAAANKHAGIEAEESSRKVATIKGSALTVQMRAHSSAGTGTGTGALGTCAVEEDRAGSQINLVDSNESRTSDYEMSAALSSSPRSPFNEPGFMLDAAGSVRLESTKRANPLCPDPFLAAGISQTGHTALNARLSNSPANAPSALRRASINSISSVTSLEQGPGPFC